MKQLGLRKLMNKYHLLTKSETILFLQIEGNFHVQLKDTAIDNQLSLFHSNLLKIKSEKKIKKNCNFFLRYGMWTMFLQS